MKTIGEMTDGELAAYVATHLRRNGIEVVLSGEACVSIHSNHLYVSMDLDLINVHFANRKRIREAMMELGFSERDRYFEHPDTEFLVEFPPGPLAIGGEPAKQVDEVEFATGTLKLLSPTDCVKDRLTWYYHSNDRQCLEQAAQVAQLIDVDLREIERWSKAEGKLNEFMSIKDRFIKTSNA